MNNNKKNKKMIIVLLFVVFLGLGILLVSSKEVRKSISNGLASLTGSDASANKIKISKASLTGIETGTESFDDSDIPGNDSSIDNRIVRSFDSINYKFNFNLVDKAGTDSYIDRSVNIDVELTPEEANYIVFEQNGLPGETNYTYTFDGINSDIDYEKSITLYVLGAPNNMEINPKFVLKESTDEDTSILLGKVSSSENYYSYENDTYSSSASFDNVLPTTVSSKQANLKMEELYIENNQVANSNGQVGRYITGVTGLYIEGDPNKGIKGMDMPTGSISFNTNVSHDGESNIILKNEWARFYGSNSIGDLESILVDAPYSNNDSGNEQKEVKNPGTYFSEIDGNIYRTTISDYKINNIFPSLTASDKQISNKYYIGTYAYSVFSPRTTQEGKKTIKVDINTNSVNVRSTNNELYQIDDIDTIIDNNYSQSSDYSYDSGFYIGDVKLNNDNKIGSLSKGTDVIYKTTFDYKTSTNEGLKELIKINPNAFRVVDFDDDNEIGIEVKCGEEDCTNITKDDFEIKYITGDYKNNNYKVDVVNNRLSDDDKELVRTTCENLDISNYTNDQIMNIYGGPCLKAEDEVEEVFTKFRDAKDEDGVEKPITKIVVQTKSGVVLPDNVKVEIKYKLRVRNVADITRLYQVTSIASTSDYDSVLKYYSPSVVDTVNKDNYKLPTINGKNVIDVTEYAYADSIRISNYTSDQEITVLNKDEDDKMKTLFETEDSDTITYNIKPIIEDNSEQSGSDDTWILKSVKVSVHLTANLTYVPNTKLDKNLTNATVSETETILEYVLPYSKPNFDQENIRFDAVINQKLKGEKVPLTIRSYISALNVNNEEDSSLFGVNYKDFTIYANGTSSVILEQKEGSNGSTVEKNEEFSYLLYAYNNTDNEVNNYSIVDILPANNDDNNSTFDGTYEVKINRPESLNSSTIYCSTEKYSDLVKDLDDSNNNWEECNDITSNYKTITAFKVTGISINANSYIEPIELVIKPTDNKSSNTYVNDFIGGLSNNKINKSNKININVVSRSISGKVFYDIDEDGTQSDVDKYVPNIPVTLYKITSEGDEKVSVTTTNNDGKYIFNDLETGLYYIELNYDGNNYDLTRRYASIDENIDSDAYKVSNIVARIANKKIPDDPFGILLKEEDLSLENYDMGLIPRYSFGFDIKKYITRTEISYNGNFSAKDYSNLNRVTVNVNNTTNASIKVYYDIEIINNSYKTGFVEEIEESIPTGMIFDSSIPENKDWVQIGGTVISKSLANTKIKPGESKHLQIVLFLNNNQSAGTFVNTVSIAKMSEYVPAPLAKEKEYQNINSYEIGEEVEFGGLSWHVIDASGVENNSQTVTLLADSGEITDLMSHTDGLYKWGLSNIKNYLDSNGMNSSLDYSALNDISVCNDSSGMEIVSYGGNISGICQSNDFVVSKVRLLSAEEYTNLITSSLSNIDWLTGNRDYWLQSADDTRPIYEMIGANLDDSYGRIETSTYNKALYVSSAGIKSDFASTLKEIRPVITISSNNILFE